jgi:hypothetical protein
VVRSAAYEGVTIAAFLLLLVEFVSASAAKGDVHNALSRKEKEGLPMTVRPSQLDLTPCLGVRLTVRVAPRVVFSVWPASLSS